MSHAVASTPIRSSADIAVVYEQIVKTIEQQYLDELIGSINIYRLGLIETQNALNITSNRLVLSSKHTLASSRNKFTSTFLDPKLEILQQEYERRNTEATNRRSERLIRAIKALAKLLRDAEIRLRESGKENIADEFCAEAVRLEEIVAGHVQTAN